jgi:hypothetical protein
MQANDRKSSNSGHAVESHAALDRRISEVESALNYSRAFLEQLCVDDEEVHQRLEEIAYSYERELDRLRSKKVPPGASQGR